MTLLDDGREGVPAGHEAGLQPDASLWVSLARRIEQRDPDAEAALALHFHPRVRAMASVRLHGSDAAADIAQDTIVEVLQSLRAGQLREPEKLPAFVRGIARNLLNSHLRAQAKSREVLDDPPDLPAESPHGDLATLDEGRRSLVREALGRLKPLDRRILLLTLVEGMTPREMSPILGLAPEAVRTRKARAVKALMGRMKKVIRKRRLDHIGKSGLRP